MKILITGAKGQLGSELSSIIPDAILADKEELDITNLEAVKQFVNNNKIDTIVNCVAYTAVDKAEDDEENTYKVNVLGAENLAKTNCKLIHISTDYVFDGKNCKPYIEDDKTGPLSVYGKTKLESENVVLKNNKQAIVIRTAWLYSTYGNNFVKTMLRLGKEKESLNVVFDQVGTPTYTKDLAETIKIIIPNINEKTSGIYHFSNEGVCSWYDFATEIMSLSNLNCKVKPILSIEYPTKATRPFYSVLNKNKIKKTFNIEIRHWKEALTECLNKI